MTHTTEEEREILKLAKENNVDIESYSVYDNRVSSVERIHTDTSSFIGEGFNDSEGYDLFENYYIVDYALVDREEYETTIEANSGSTVSDYEIDEPVAVVVLWHRKQFE